MKKIIRKELIALDIGNVCVCLNYDKCLETLGYDSSMIPLSFIHTINAYECGKITTAEWLQEFRKITENKFSNIELIKAYNIILGEEIASTRELVEKTVLGGGRVIFFSNISEVHANHIFSSLSFSHLISGTIFSFQAKVQKPHINIYKSFEKKYGKPTLYLDDKVENLQAARTYNSWKVQHITQ